MSLSNGLQGLAEKFGPITIGPEHKCPLVPANMATTVSALRAVTVTPSTYLVYGGNPKHTGLQLMAERVIGLTQAQTEKAKTIFVYGGNLQEALSRLEKGGVLVVIGIGQGKANRALWMQVRPFGNILLQRFGAPVSGPDKTGDVGVGIIEKIRIEAETITPQAQTVRPPETVETAPVIKYDGRRGGRMSHARK